MVTNLDKENKLPVNRMIDRMKRSLTIITRARIGSESIAHESIAHEAEWAIDSEAMRARGIIVLVKSK